MNYFCACCDIKYQPRALALYVLLFGLQKGTIRPLSGFCCPLRSNT